MKFKSHKKGTITSPFSDNSGYRPHTHTGVDWVIGYGNPVTTDNPGQVAHIDTNGTDGWRAVWVLSPTPSDGLIEVCFGHLKDIYVRAGEWVEEDQQVGTEGNFGLVFQNGVQITPEMREAGDRRGSHVHEQWRPVQLVDKKTRGKHYRPYKHNGKYVEVVHTNATRGCIDPMDYDVSAKELLLNELKEQFEKTKEDFTEENVSVLRKLWTAVLKVWK